MSYIKSYVDKLMENLILFGVLSLLFGCFLKPSIHDDRQFVDLALLFAIFGPIRLLAIQYKTKKSGNTKQ